MGCGASEHSDPVTKSVLGGLAKEGQHLSRGSIASIKKMAVDTLNNNAILTKDEKKTIARTGTEGAFQSQDDQMVDGLLGVSSQEEIEKIKASIKKGSLFADTKFPASSVSLHYSKNKENSKIRWLRPKELTDQPRLTMDKMNKRDVIQGHLGDCWFLSACAALTQKPMLLKKVIPKGQVLYGDNYMGLVVFQLWRFGRWVTVCVDDQLPTCNGQLVYGRCSNPNEFWVPLLEKAYAKLHGSYEALVGGQAKDALVDLTGGIAEFYPLQDVPEDFYRRLHRAYIKGAFITCARIGEWDNANTVDEKGLVSGHAYTITHAATVLTKSGKYVNLVRIRNPWGDGAEWKGNWSDHSARWKEISENIKQSLEVKIENDGEFWMSYQDFKKEFRDVTICTLGPDSGLSTSNCQVEMIKGAWQLDNSAGGSRNNVQNFARNPQYKFTISEEEIIDDDEVDLSGRRSVVIALMQEHRLSQNKSGLKLAHIGFVIYKGDDSDRKLPPEYILTNHDMGTTGPHVNFREVTARFHLVPGSYIIIPSTFEENCPRPFLIRVYCDQPFTLREQKGKPIRGWENMQELQKKNKKN